MYNERKVGRSIFKETRLDEFHSSSNSLLTLEVTVCYMGRTAWGVILALRYATTDVYGINVIRQVLALEVVYKMLGSGYTCTHITRHNRVLLGSSCSIILLEEDNSQNLQCLQNFFIDKTPLNVKGVHRELSHPSWFNHSMTVMTLLRFHSSSQHNENK